MPTRIQSLDETPRPQGGNPPGAKRPEWFVGKSEAQLAKRVGLTQFGVNHMTLAPGAYSALRHWHEQEDEFVYVLFGELTLIDEHGEHPLKAGDYAGFPAGEANAHHLANRSDQPAAYIAVGTRHRGRDTLHYPEDFDGPVHVDRDERGDRIRR